MAFVNEKPGNLPRDGWRTIDYGRNAYLVSKGTCHGRESRSGGEKFDFFYKGKSFPFAAYIDHELLGKQQNIHWEIFQLSIPGELEADRNEILTLISDALDAYGSMYDRTDILKVTVNFSRLV